ncbi:MAG: hypothetical protein ACMXYK_03145 [Candidatus Woesearchaeota archaeon]
MRKSQITIFIILGLVLVFLVVFVSFLQTSSISDVIIPQSENIRLQPCFESLLDQSYMLLGVDTEETAVYLFDNAHVCGIQPRDISVENSNTGLLATIVYAQGEIVAQKEFVTYGVSEVISSDGAAHFTSSEDIQLSIITRAPMLGSVSSLYSFSPSGHVFSEPARLRIYTDDLDMANGIALLQDDATWRFIETDYFDGYVEADIEHFSTYAYVRGTCVYGGGVNCDGTCPSHTPGVFSGVRHGGQGWTQCLISSSNACECRCFEGQMHCADYTASIAPMSCRVPQADPVCEGLPMIQTVSNSKYLCEEVGPVDTQGIFALKTFNDQLFIGKFGYGKRDSMLSVYPNLRQANPGVVLGESVCALEEFNGKLVANTEHSGDIFISSDGFTWQRTYAGRSGTIGCALTVFNGHIYAVNYDIPNNRNGLILRSADGISWETVFDSGSSGLYLRDLGFYGNIVFATGVDFSSRQGKILQSTTGNPGSWQIMNTPSRFMRNIVHNNVLYFSSTTRTSNGPSGIFKHTGDSYFQLHSEPLQYVTDFAVLNGTLFAGTSAGWKVTSGQARLLASEDGISFTPICDFPEPEIWSLEVFDGALYLGTKTEQGPGKLYRITERNVTDTVPCDNAPGGFLWKPVSEHDRNLAVVLPNSFNHNTCNRAFVGPLPIDESAAEYRVSAHTSIELNGRVVYRFSKPGAEYCDGGPCGFSVTCDDHRGTIVYEIPVTANRCE